MANQKRVSADNYMRRIGHHLSRNEVSQAKMVASALNSEHPTFARGWVAAAQVAMSAHDKKHALNCIGNACKLDRVDPLVNAYAADVFARTGNFRRGMVCAETVLKSQTNEDSLFDLAGNAFSLGGNQFDAKQCFQKAAKLNPNQPSYLFNLAATERYFGEIDLAEQHLEKLVQIEPTNWEAHYGLSHLRRQSEETSHITKLKSLLGHPNVNWAGMVRLHYALGKEYEDLGNISNATDHYLTAAKTQREHTKYTPSAELDTIESIIELHTEEAFAGRSIGQATESPVFILGLPRTGSTLVERILDAHPGVVSKGELNECVIALLSCVSSDASRDKRNLVKHSLDIDFDTFGKKYLERAKEHAPHGDRFIDKMPLNSLYVGLILQALPNAKIIYVERDPLDAAIAIYTTLFNRAYAWSYDLDEVYGYMEAHRRLMNHWRKCFSGRLFSISYEDVVLNQKKATERLLKYCDLPWNDACLQFHQSRSASTTASAVQVREKLYSTSVGRWKKFEPYIGDVLEKFKSLQCRSTTTMLGASEPNIQ